MLEENEEDKNRMKKEKRMACWRSFQEGRILKIKTTDAASILPFLHFFHPSPCPPRLSNIRLDFNIKCSEEKCTNCHSQLDIIMEAISFVLHLRLAQCVTCHKQPILSCSTQTHKRTPLSLLPQKQRDSLSGGSCMHQCSSMMQNLQSLMRDLLEGTSLRWASCCHWRKPAPSLLIKQERNKQNGS